MIPIQIDSKTRVPKISKHLKILKMRSLEGCETKSMQNFGFFKPFLRGFGQFFGFLVHCDIVCCANAVETASTNAHVKVSIMHS